MLHVKDRRSPTKNSAGSRPPVMSNNAKSSTGLQDANCLFAEFQRRQDMFNGLKATDQRKM
jgi:hypothetical protein